jgi:acetyl-CoA carboxylase beta subunit
LLEHGQLDLVVERRELRETLRRILAFFCRRGPSTEA